MHMCIYLINFQALLLIKLSTFSETVLDYNYGFKLISSKVLQYFYAY